MSNNKDVARNLEGTVVSNKMNKGIVVLIERRVKHPKYGKYIKLSSKIHAADPENKCNNGDIVVIEECRPVSKTISWRLVDIKVKAA